MKLPPGYVQEGSRIQVAEEGENTFRLLIKEAVDERHGAIEVFFRNRSGHGKRWNLLKSEEIRTC